MKLVQGVPFSAKGLSETTQTLADGSKVVRKTEALFARDNEGRTRREQKLVGKDASIIFIQDPVLGLAYVVDGQVGLVEKRPLQTIPDIQLAPNMIFGENSLGTQVLDGFLVEGGRLSQTIPANSAGNESSLEIVFETWYSPQLQTVVKKTTFDPRIGRTDFRLSEIQLGEPPEALFTIPDKYVIRESQRGVRSLVVEKSKE